MSPRSYVGIGTNLGDRSANYRKAIKKLAELPDTRVTGISSIYESEPHGRARNWFLNGVLELTTGLNAKKLLKALLQIETGMGRKRDPNAKSVSRIIDLDLLLHGQEVIDSRNLKVPHPGLPNRRFVLLPLSEIQPRLLHPVTGQSVTEMLKATDDDKGIRFFREDK